MRGRRVLALLGAMAVSACYVNTPVDTSVRPLAPGDRVALDISDQGRVGLGERFGPGVTQIEGRIKAANDQTLSLQVFRVSYLREGDSRWTGEEVVLDRTTVGRTYQRTLSKGRTAATVAAVGGGLLAFIVTRAIVSSGRERDPDPEPPEPPISTRFPHFQIIH